MFNQQRTYLWLIITLIGFVLFSTGPTFGEPLDKWHIRNPALQVNDLYDVAYGNNIFVAVGDNGKILTSPDGINWSLKSTAANHSLLRIIFANNKFVVVGDGGTIFISSDGINWTAGNSGITDTLNSVSYGNGEFLAVGYHGIILGSSDGIAWTRRSSGTDISLTDVTFGDNKFVAVGDGTIVSSSDGITWSSSTLGAQFFYGITFWNNLFVVVGSNGKVLTSSDLITWTIQSSGTINGLFRVSSINNSFVSVGTKGTIISSSDGITWANKPSPVVSAIRGITYGNNIYVLVGEYGFIYSSTDGENWVERLSGYGDKFLSGITYGNNKFIGIGQGWVYSSTDGLIWSRYSVGSSTDPKINLYAINFGNGLFIATGTNENGCAIYKSSDGSVWTETKTITPGYREHVELSGVTYGNGIYVVVGYLRGVAPSGSPLILSSPDGSTWTMAAGESFSGTLSDVTYGNNFFVAVGTAFIEAGISVSTSPDGENWSCRTLGINVYPYGITYGNNIFVAVGNNGTILTSSDGTTWSISVATSNNSLSGITYGNGIFVAVGSQGTILTSTDGLNWTPRNSGVTSDLSKIAFGNNTFVVVGEGEVILQSDPLPGVNPFYPNTKSFEASGGVGSLNVTTTTTDYAWTATSDVTWITITSGGSGIGDGTLNYSVAENSGAVRTGTITVGGQTFTITQAGPTSCTYTITPTSVSFDSLGNTGTVAVTTSESSCSWSAVSNAPWITITAGSEGTGNGTVSYSISANTAESARTGTITVGGQTFTITQAGPTSCTYTITPTSASFDSLDNTGTVAVTTSESSCSWSAVSNAPWITITAGSEGTGNGTVSYSISANTAESARTGTITVGGQTFTITQAGTDAPPSPPPSPPPSGGGGGGCFIATAAFGSPMERHVQILRDFRDQNLLSYSLGQKLVKLYYQTSPPVAETIAKSEVLRLMTRWCLMPVIGFAYMTVSFGLMTTLLIITFVSLLLISFVWVLRKRGSLPPFR